MTRQRSAGGIPNVKHSTGFRGKRYAMPSRKTSPATRRSKTWPSDNPERAMGLGRPPTRGSASVMAPVEGSRPRPRTDVLLPDKVDATDLESVVDLMVNVDASQDDREEVAACVQDSPSSPTMPACDGYLAWRYSAAHRRAYPDSGHH